MITPQYTLDLNDEIIVDNFAGGGGASTGIELATGRHVDVAINHDAKAIAMHMANHPQTLHLCESVWDINPRDVMPGRKIALLWLSPDCKHFSKAKGGKPVEKKIRGLAWVGVRWAAIRKPRVIKLENVEEFVTWGPLTEDGKPCPKNKGREFRSFVNALQKLGYVVDWRELRGCDYGAPTIRKRMFLIARCDGKPIVWPEPTHAEPSKAKALKLKPWRTAAECMDWSLPCPSIFERNKPLAEATCKRIAKGIMRYVVNNGDPFIITTDRPITNRSVPRSIQHPTPTATANQRIALVTPFITEHANASNQRNMSADDPLRTQCAQVKGGHFALVSAFLAKNYTGVVGSDIKDPLHTVTSVDHHSLVASNLVKLRNNCIGQSNNEPLHTLTASTGHFAEVRAFLVSYYGSETETDNIKAPLRTITSRDRFGLVTIHGIDYQIADIGLRMLAPKELFKAQGFPDSYIMDKGMTIDAAGNISWIQLTKTEQVRMVGNSVCPPLAAALVRANLPELIVQKVAA